MSGQERFRIELGRLQEYCQEVAQTISGAGDSTTQYAEFCGNLRAIMGRLFGIAEELNDYQGWGVTISEVDSESKTLFDCIESFRRKNVYYDLLIFEEAVKELKRVLDENSDRHVVALAYNGLGHVYALRKMYAPAINYFSKVVELYPENNDGYYNLGAAWFNLGSYEEAQHHFIQAIYHHPEDWEAYFYLGKTYEKLGDMESADYYIKRAREIKYGSKSTTVLIG